MAGEPESIGGQSIGPYEVLSQIGHGTMGRVLKARQAKLNRMVALKLLDPSLAQDADGVRRFLNEARAASSLRHPNIAAVIDVGTCPQSGYQYIAFELVEGSSLEARLRRGPMSEGDALRVASGIADALTCTETHNVVHRDVRPANILLTPEGKPKLIDLGLSKRLDQTGSITAGAVVSSPHYVAPEQAMALPDLDTRADIYALGITLYQCVTGELPFDGNDFLLVVTRHVNEDVPDPRAVNPDISAACAEVIAGLCARKREQRYTARGALHDLKRVLSGDEPLGPLAAADAVAAGVKPRHPAGAPAARTPTPVVSNERIPSPTGVDPNDSSDSKMAAPQVGLPFRLTVTSPDGERRELIFDQPVVTIGRDAKCDLHINDKTVSRRHCEILRNGLTYALAARETANGTFVNDQAVTEMQLLTPVDEVRVAEGFRIKLTPLPRDEAQAARARESSDDLLPIGGGGHPVDDPYATPPAIEVDETYRPAGPAVGRAPATDPRRSLGERKGEPGSAPKRIGARVPREDSPPSDRNRIPTPPDRADPPSDRARLTIRPDPPSERARVPAPVAPASRADPPFDRARAPGRADPPSDRSRIVTPAAPAAPPGRADPPSDRARVPSLAPPMTAPERKSAPERKPALDERTPSTPPVRATGGAGSVVVVHEDGREERITLGASFKLGRGQECDVQLAHPHAPRKAALIVRGPDGHRLFNVAPAIDTVRLNGEPVADEALLAHGDELSVYGLTVRFEAS